MKGNSMIVADEKPLNVPRGFSCRKRLVREQRRENCFKRSHRTEDAASGLVGCIQLVALPLASGGQKDEDASHDSSDDGAAEADDCWLYLVRGHGEPDHGSQA
jgi:hypothetical protein